MPIISGKDASVLSYLARYRDVDDARTRRLLAPLRGEALAVGRALAGKKIAHPLWEPQAGYWIRVAGDTVRALDQQYTP